MQHSSFAYFARNNPSTQSLHILSVIMQHSIFAYFAGNMSQGNRHLKHRIMFWGAHVLTSLKHQVDFHTCKTMNLCNVHAKFKPFNLTAS
jgi:hypothetical protein